MKIVLYARVSSEQQAERDLSIPAQLKTLREYAIKRDWTIVHEYIDSAQSARTADRPSFQEMIATAKQKDKPFQAILVWKLNRFARNREDSIIYKSLLRKKGIQVISVNENFDEGPSGRLLEGIIEVIDEFYSANLSQDTVRGMKENTMRGFLNGRHKPYGYTTKSVPVGKSVKKKLEIDSAEAPVVRKIFELCLEGKGLKEIVKNLNDAGIKRRDGKSWSTSSIAYILKNETYTGCLIWNEGKHNPRTETPVVRIPDTHEAIISQEEFKAARRLMKARTREVVHPRSLSSPRLLSTLLTCNRCGSSMASVGAKSGQFYYYTCQTYIKKGRKYCDQKLIRADKLEPFIIDLLKKRILTEGNVKKLLLMVNKELKAFEKEYTTSIALLDKSLEQKLSRRRKLYNIIETGRVDLTDIGPRIKEINAEIDALNDEKKELEKRYNNEQCLMVDEETLKPYVDDLRATLMKGSIPERKAFIRKFVKNIKVTYPEIEVEYSLPVPLPPERRLQNRRTSAMNSDNEIQREVLSIEQVGDPSGI